MCGEGGGQLRDPDPPRRFTPTCVGKARISPHTASMSAVHPHVCGEGFWTGLLGKLRDGSPPRVWGRRVGNVHRKRDGGSPPRVWGRRHQFRHSGTPRRFTPTCVGKAQWERLVLRQRTVHPHVCGEGDDEAGRLPVYIGSPPRVWGRRRTDAPMRGRRSVHPHVCGEGTYGRGMSGNGSGSPPRVWGRRAERVIHPPDPLVHPHVCGEGTIAARALISAIGSPPRVWGRRRVRVGRRLRGRFTPTCVGKAGGMLRRGPRSPVHPHVCGEGCVTVTPDHPGTGSPPRVWGRRAG